MSHLVEDDDALTNKFMAYAGGLLNARVVEMGTHQSQPGRSTMHKRWVPRAKEYIGTDFEAGTDVDVLADAHKLSGAFKPGSVDVLISVAVMEHLERPWIVAEEIAKILAPHGCIFITTHQSFPLHGFPRDYFRFSREAMEILFHRDLGFRNVETSYQFPCQVVSQRDPGGKDHPAFLNVNLFATKAP